ncbi:MAG: hypothetical protein KME08_10955 [Aphanothece sp. CMT-3BRIN-NPC111]|jgi:glycosyltransferase involved in cell wall biosynthesis|nr:hypothetical protein [Aphanothece sp. CMT-3BRIN-NPC111]
MRIAQVSPLSEPDPPWREPFGLVMSESIATGTQLIAHDKTGFLYQSYEEMAAMIPASLQLERQTCRVYVETKFNITQMVDAYEAA